MSTRPDFCIAGAPKCGTTALFEYLSRHPAVFMPRIKEPNFFCTDLKTTGGVSLPAQYQQLFAAAPPSQLTGEASALYLFSAVALQRLTAHNPRVKIIVLLRDPVEAAHSLHAARWGYGHENIADFEQAWRAQGARLRGAQLPPRWPEPKTLQYGPIYRYAAQVRRLLEQVPPQQRQLLVHEEFFAEPARHFAQVLAFLGLQPLMPEAFPVVNRGVDSRFSGLERWLRAPHRRLRALYAPLRPLFSAVGLRPLQMAARLNRSPRGKPALRAQFRAELEAYFADDIAELEGLLGRSLWRPGTASVPPAPNAREAQPPQNLPL